MTRGSQFVSLGLAQLAGRVRLRDVVGNLTAQAHKLYPLWVAPCGDALLACPREREQPYGLYEALFGKRLARCQSVSPKRRFGFKNKLYSLEASTIDLCLSRCSRGRTSAPPRAR